jgi:transposase
MKGANKVKLIAESKKKTNRIDAQLLAHLLRVGGLPEPVHVPSHRSRELRGLLAARGWCGCGPGC